MKYKRYDILEVEWLDSHTKGGWISPLDYKKWVAKADKLFLIKTIGYFVDEDENFLRLAMGHDNQKDYEDGQGEDNLDMCYAVAKKCIRKIRKLG